MELHFKIHHKICEGNHRENLHTPAKKFIGAYGVPNLQWVRVGAMVPAFSLWLLSGDVSSIGTYIPWIMILLIALVCHVCKSICDIYAMSFVRYVSIYVPTYKLYEMFSKHKLYEISATIAYVNLPFKSKRFDVDDLLMVFQKALVLKKMTCKKALLRPDLTLFTHITSNLYSQRR